jgi:hypothetical protein
MYLPLVAAGLPQMPGNSGPDGLSFAKGGFRQLLALNITGQDLRIGSRFTGERADAVARALAEARRRSGAPSSGSARGSSRSS